MVTKIAWPSLLHHIEENQLDELIKMKKQSELRKEEEDTRDASKIDLDSSTLDPPKTARAAMSKRKMLQIKAELYQKHKPSLDLLDQ